MLAVLLLAGAGLYWRLRPRPVDPATVDLPPAAADSAAVQRYFRGPGAPLLTLLSRTGQLPATSTRDGCLDLASQLNAIGSPKVLSAAAAAVPDQGLAAAAINHVNAVVHYLAACGSGRDLSARAGDATFTAVVLTRLLAREQVR